jgi:hypothetical protein
MQEDPLLEKLDWVFTSASWTSSYPATSVHCLSRPISDHIPYVVMVDSHIPKASLFRFENFWVDFPGFYDTVKLHWDSNPFFSNMARTISAKFKQLRKSLKAWYKELFKLNKLINNCSWVLALIDGLEDQRLLLVVELNFRKIVKKYLQNLLEAKRIYWRQRSTIRWAKFGDENTKVFQSLATISFRQNAISSLLDADGQPVHVHSLKAGILQNSFKDRLGVSEFTEILFDLNDLIRVVPLPGMDAPFSKEEIDLALKEMPPDHALGPDGFNGFFFKKCWHQIKDDFYRLCDCFYSGNINLECINGSFIVLIPKRDNPQTPNDFRSISLLNLSLKLITKLLANRLQKVILSVVHANQYGFLKGRTIQDCLAWAFQFRHLCHHSKKEIVIVKLDFGKAFDKAEHPVILEMIRHKGFSEKWIIQIHLILSSASSSVLLNGVPGKPFKCERGVHQGDPLSPLLFVIAADLLQSVVNSAASEGLLLHPLGNNFGGDYPIVQYADDTLLIMPVN